MAANPVTVHWPHKIGGLYVLLFIQMHTVIGLCNKAMIFGVLGSTAKPSAKFNFRSFW